LAFLISEVPTDTAAIPPLSVMTIETATKFYNFSAQFKETVKNCAVTAEHGKFYQYRPMYRYFRTASVRLSLYISVTERRFDTLGQKYGII
jgi:hypothetical protein